MAVANGRTGAAVIGQLFREPYRFDFFQAVRLLDSHARREAETRRRYSVGHDAAPVQEIVRFRVPASLSFAAASIVALAAPDGDGAERIGAARDDGPVPGSHRSQRRASRSTIRPVDRHAVTSNTRTTCLREYFDLFHHRLISLFYRAWEKNHFQFAFERVQLEKPGEDDDFTFALYSLVGLGRRRNKLRRRMAFDDEAAIFLRRILCTLPAQRHQPGVHAQRLLGDSRHGPAIPRPVAVSERRRADGAANRGPPDWSE